MFDRSLFRLEMVSTFFEWQSDTAGNTFLRGILGDLSAVDLSTKETLYTECAWYCRRGIFLTLHIRSDQECKPGIFQAELNSFKFVYCHQMIMEVNDYIFKGSFLFFGAGETELDLSSLQTSSSGASEERKNTTSSSPLQGSIFSGKPLVIFPIHRQSRDFIQLRLESISITNKYLSVAHPTRNSDNLCRDAHDHSIMPAATPSSGTEAEASLPPTKHSNANVQDIMIYLTGLTVENSAGSNS